VNLATAAGPTASSPVGSSVDVRCGERLARELERRNVEPDMRQYYRKRMAAYVRAHESDHLAGATRGGRGASDPSLRPIAVARV